MLKIEGEGEGVTLFVKTKMSAQGESSSPSFEAHDVVLLKDVSARSEVFSLINYIFDNSWLEQTTSSI